MKTSRTYPISSQRTGSTSHMLQPLAGTVKMAGSSGRLVSPYLASPFQAASPMSPRALSVGRKRVMRAMILSMTEMLRYILIILLFTRMLEVGCYGVSGRRNDSFILDAVVIEIRVEVMFFVTTTKLLRIAWDIPQQRSANSINSSH